jgi:23S rRNA (uracil1939-C5)-methyltransferase
MVITLKLQEIGHGGYAIGRDKQNRVIFVPNAIPGETVEVDVPDDATGKRFAHAQLRRVLKPVKARVDPRCAHASEGSCSSFQHVAYETQLYFKQQIVQDQFQRIAKLKPEVRKVLPSPLIWEYQREVRLSPTAVGGLGLWSARAHQVLPIDNCTLLVPALRELLSDFDLDLPTLRKVTLRQGADEALLVALEVEDVEPPELLVDFPVSVTIVLPDETTANLIGENFVTSEIKERLFQVSAGCYFYRNPAGAGVLVDAVLAAANLHGRERLLELYTGVGTLTAFLAEQTSELVGIEKDGDAVADCAVNLQAYDHISLYQSDVLDSLPGIELKPDVAVVHAPADGVPTAVWRTLLTQHAPRRLVHISDDLATLARDSQQLSKAGYRLRYVQPIDLSPHTFEVTAVVLWER